MVEKEEPENKGPKVQDLTPEKDAKGGGARSADAAELDGLARRSPNGGQNLDRSSGAN